MKTAAIMGAQIPQGITRRDLRDSVQAAAQHIRSIQDGAIGRCAGDNFKMAISFNQGALECGRAACLKIKASFGLNQELKIAHGQITNSYDAEIFMASLSQELTKGEALHTHDRSEVEQGGLSAIRLGHARQGEFQDLYQSGNIMQVLQAIKDISFQDFARLLRETQSPDLKAVSTARRISMDISRAIRDDPSRVHRIEAIPFKGFDFEDGKFILKIISGSEDTRWGANEREHLVEDHLLNNSVRSFPSSSDDPRVFTRTKLVQMAGLMVAQEMSTPESPLETNMHFYGVAIVKPQEKVAA